MRPNPVKDKLKNGEIVINGWLHIPSTWSAEVMANAGWDSVTVDMQHGMMGIETAIGMLQAISTTDTVPFLRVNWNEPGIIMKMLDGGAYGIICPMVDTPEQAQAFIDAVRYPPLGERSLGPTRARVYAGMDYAEHANDTVLAFAMVETATGLENVEAIAATPGLDGIFVGAGDLRFSLFGEVGLDGSSDTFKDALRRILSACKDAGITPGIFCASTDYAHQMIDMGFKFLTIKSDTLILTEVAAQLVEAVRNPKENQ
ncbi:MAG: aldolase/citrate lyase family protein [Chloroflexota bacterium]